MGKILMVMGSDSDFPIIEPALKILDDFAVEREVHVCSAHRTPVEASSLAKEAQSRGFKVIIACAGLAAHLPGVLAAYTSLPVIGLPISSPPLNGLDALYSIVQMPPGVPVATVGINNAKNAALLAIQILALSDTRLMEMLNDYKIGIAKEVEEKNLKLQEKL